MIVSGELLTSSQLLAYLSANTFLYPEVNFVSNHPANELIKYQWNRLAILSAKIGLAIISLLLITGQIVKAYAKNYSKETANESLVVQSVTSEINNLTARLNNANEFILMNNYDDATKFSYYSDGIDSLF